MLPTLIEHGMTTVVIIPLVALGADMKARCNKAGIRWAEWQGTDLLKR
jgi:superfamily II DNA helicase RecQ